MRAPRSLVTGGTGYVGRFIVEALLAAGHEVTVAGRSAPEEGFFSSGTSFRRLDLGAVLPDAGLFDGVDYVVHAAFDHVPGRYRGGEGDDAEGFREKNLLSTVALFDAASRAGVARTVFLSSRAVYGPKPAGTLLDETTTPEPETLYGEIKLRAEDALMAMGDGGTNGTVLRVTGVYGPAGRGREHKWAGLFSDYLAGATIAPRAGTEVHGRDVGAAVRLVLEAAETRVAGQTFNVSDILVDRRDMLTIVREATGAAYDLPTAADKDAINVMRTEKLAALGWKPGGLTLFDRTVRELVRRG